jgi:DNA-binding transcriptional MerR regulator
VVVVPRKNKIVQLGWPAEQELLRLRNEGKSYREIADELSTKFDTDMTHNSVQNYLQNNKDEHLARMTREDRGRLEEKKMEKILDVGGKLEEIDEQLETIRTETLSADDKNDVGQILNVIKEVRQLMKFQKEYIEDVTQPNTEINNYEVTNNTAIQISEKLMELEQDGIIEIKEPEQLKR